ncbi:MAG: hypothetical protein CL608_19250 [Anaerolineaceae bacterium]|nr:hypothetical protein [Anaerolineaceae bacterium]
MINLLLTLYKLMLRLYPSRFYHTFGPEMAEVFAEKLHHSANARSVLVTFGHELRHWPGSLWREHWSAQQSALNFPRYEKLSWAGTAVAALPYLLMALVFAAFLFLTNQNIFEAVLLGSTMIMLAVAWWRRWPAWSASWLGFLAFLLFYMLLPQYLGAGHSEWTATERLLRMMLAELIYFLPLFAVFYWLVGRWPWAGAVALLPPIGFSWLLHMEFVPPNLTLLIYSVTWIWLAVIVVLLARWVPRQRQGWILGLAALVIGLLSAFAGQFWVNIPRDGSFTRMAENFLAEFVPTLLPLMAILLLHALRRKLVASNGRSSLRHYRYIFLGIVGLIGSSQLAQRLFLPDDLAMFQANVGVMVTAVFLLSLFGIGLGAWRLRHSQPGGLLLTLVILFPFLYQAETIAVLLGELPILGPPNDYMLYEAVRLGGRAVGLLWLAVAAWLLNRTVPPLPENMPPDEAAPILAS